MSQSWAEKWKFLPSKQHVIDHNFYATNPTLHNKTTKHSAGLAGWHHADDVRYFYIIYNVYILLKMKRDFPVSKEQPCTCIYAYYSIIYIIITNINNILEKNEPNRKNIPHTTKQLPTHNLHIERIVTPPDLSIVCMFSKTSQFYIALRTFYFLHTIML